MRIAKQTQRQLLVFALLLLPNRTYAYDPPGHFYTVTDALEQLDVPATSSWDDDRAVIGFCSWLPDASVELSATGVIAAAASSYSAASGSNILAWGLRNPLGFWKIKGCLMYDAGRIDFDPNTMQPVVIVQQFIHGLTGGDPATMTSVAHDLASGLWKQANLAEGQERTNLLCATGFAMHLLGDSYAHRHLLDREHSSEVPMYPTGCGHASAPDSGQEPDHPLAREERWKDWQAYFDDIATVFGSSGYKANATAWFSQFNQFPPQSTSDEGECFLEETLWEHIKGLAQPPTDCTHPGYAYSPDLGIPCQEYANNSAPKLNGSPPNCKATWAIYKKAALQSFARYPGAIASQYDYNNPPFGMKDFYEGAEPAWQ